MMSKQLAAIETKVPLELDLGKLQVREPDPAALMELYRELGFNSLLKELLASGAVERSGVGPGASEGASGQTGAEKKDYVQFATAEELRGYLKKLPAKAPLSLWLNLDPGERESEGFGTHLAGIELSSKVGEGRAVWADEKGEALRALEPVLGDEKRRKLVHDPKLFQLLAGRTESIEHATQLYDYLLRPTTAKHEFADVVFRNFNAPIGGGAGERADCLQRLAPVLRKQVEE